MTSVFTTYLQLPRRIALSEGLDTVDDFVLGELPYEAGPSH